MDNNKLMDEANRISDELIKIRKSDEDLETLFNKLLDEEFKNTPLNVMVYISKCLAQKKFYIDSSCPFELKEI